MIEKNDSIKARTQLNYYRRIFILKQNKIP